MEAARASSVHNYVQTAVKIKEFVANLPEQLVTWKPGPNKWSIQEIVGHLMDSNITNTYRIRKIISEPVTPLVSFAHEEWVSEQQFHDIPMTDILAAYTALTCYNALLLQKLTEEQWQMYGMKQDERISVAHIVDQFICKHVDKHLGQMERNKAEYNAAR